MTEKQRLIDMCRWYEHRERLVDGDAKLCEFVERWWFEEAQRASEENDPFKDMLTDYLLLGLGEFEKTDSTPITLKAVLYNRWKSTYEYGSVDDFKKFYTDVYMR